MAANKKRGGFLSRLFFILYLILLAYFLFFADSMGRTTCSSYRYNLVLFQEIKRFFYHSDALGMKAVWVNLYGNVLAFVPFGYFVPRNSKSKIGFLSTVILSFLFSFTIEGIQLITMKGSFDVDDLFLNTVGGILGFILYIVVNPFIKDKVKDKVKDKEKDNKGE